MKKIKKTQSRRPVSVVLVGISGMGLHYLKALLEEFSPQDILLQAVVDPFPKKSELYPELRQRGIPVFSSLDMFYAEGHSAELAVISSPIHYHVLQSCEALRHGSHVLCEKPLGATIQEAYRLVQAKEEVRRWIMVGYQWSYTEAIQSLKKSVLQGALGKPRRLKTLCLWPRGKDYYEKSTWLGRIKDEAGNWILDSPANNAMAHFLHNLFYVLGERADTSASPVAVEAELYRAYPIENFDSVACRASIQDGVELLFYASHTVPEDRGPMFSFEFEEAQATYGETSDDVVITDIRGKKRHCGSPEAEHPFKKLFEAVKAVRIPIPVLCGPEAASSQILCVNGIQESVPEITNFSDSMINRDNAQNRLWVKGLDEALVTCYQRGILPSEANFPWAQRGKKVDLRDYHFYPGGVPPELRQR